jgi:hypothetical protein
MDVPSGLSNPRDASLSGSSKPRAVNTETISTSDSVAFIGGLKHVKFAISRSSELLLEYFTEMALQTAL